MISLLNRPLFFNFIRRIIAGKQEETKKFVSNNIKEYKCKKILDVCCGTGDFAVCAGKNKYLGIDIMQSYIDFARKKFSKDQTKKFIVQDLINKSFFLKEKYDCALLISTLHHFSDQDLGYIFKLLKKSIKGIVILADLDNNPPGLLRKIMVKLDRGKYTRSNREKILLLSKHFKIIKTKSIKSRLALQYGIVCQS